MAAHNNIPDLEVFGRGRGDFKLPYGYVDGEGRVFNHVYLREMTGVEDDIMGDDDLNVSERMTGIIANCIEKLTSNASEGQTTITDRDEIFNIVADNLPEGKGHPLTIPDRMACLLFIRQLSLGNSYNLDGRRCPACNQPMKNKNIDLRSLKVNYCKAPGKRQARVALKKSGGTAVLQVLCAKGERRIAEAGPTQKNANSYSILGRLVSINDKKLTGDDETDLATVQALPRKDRTTLLHAINLMEEGIETEIETRCKKAGCQAEFKFDLDLGQVFFSNPEEADLTVETLDWV